MNQEHRHPPPATPRPTLIVMAKAPRAGEVKTRLTPALSAAAAAGFAACCVQDVVRTGRQFTPRVAVAYAPADGRAALAPLLPSDVAWIAQRGADLGERMAAAFAEALSAHDGPAIMIGIDSPTLPRAILAAAEDALDRSDVVIGPAEDGGYYLIGLRRAEAQLFRGVEWSTSRACAQTEANALRLGLSVCRLPLWYDVDTPDDLRRLRAELFSLPEQESCAPQVTRWLRANLP